MNQAPIWELPVEVNQRVSVGAFTKAERSGDLLLVVLL